MRRPFLSILLVLASLLLCSCQPGSNGSSRVQGTWDCFTTADGLSSDQVWDIALDHNGTTWFATGQGVSAVDAQGNWTRYQVSDGLASNNTTAIAVDGQDRIWVTTWAGVNFFDGAAWRTLVVEASDLLTYHLTRLAVDAQNNLWALSPQGLYTIHADGSIAYVGNPFPADNVPAAMTVDAKGHIWVGTAAQDFIQPLLAEYDPDKKQWSALEGIDDRAGIPTPSNADPGFPMICGMAADRQAGHLWIADTASHFLERDGEKWQSYLPDLTPTTVFVDAKGYKWVGVYRPPEPSLLLLSPNGRQRPELSVDPANGCLDGVWITDIACTSQGVCWFATMKNGVIRFRPGKE